jgi:hypothetical protein
MHTAVKHIRTSEQPQKEDQITRTEDAWQACFSSFLLLSSDLQISCPLTICSPDKPIEHCTKLVYK